MNIHSFRFIRNSFYYAYDPERRLETLSYKPLKAKTKPRTLISGDVKRNKIINDIRAYYLSICFLIDHLSPFVMDSLVLTLRGLL